MMLTALATPVTTKTVSQRDGERREHDQRLDPRDGGVADHRVEQPRSQPR